MTDIEFLATVSIFSDLSSSAREEVLSRTDKRACCKNCMIVMEGEFGDRFFMIHKGSVKITRIREDGREVILAILGESDFFGELSLLDGKPRSAHAIALEDTEVLTLKRDDFLSFLERHSTIAIALLTELVKRIRRSHELIESLCWGNAHQRIGSTLVRLAEQLGSMLGGAVVIKNLPYRHDIARMAGTSLGTVSRTIKVFRDRGVVKGRGRSLSIPDYMVFKRMFGWPPPAA